MDLDHACKILEVDLRASPEQIRQAYLDLVKVWHPDKYQHEAPRFIKKAELHLQEINAAYEFLKERIDSRRSAGTSSAANRPTPAESKPPPREPPKPKSKPQPKSQPGPRPRPDPSENVPNNDSANGSRMPFWFLTLLVLPLIRVFTGTPGSVATTAPAAVSVPVAAATSACFSVGSTSEEVIKVQGYPKKFKEKLSWEGGNYSFFYGDSKVYFKNKLVVGWEDNDHNLRISCAPRKDKTPLAKKRIPL